MNTQKLNNTGLIILLVAMSAITQAGLVLYTPAFAKISDALHISFPLLESTLTSYLFGFGISQLFYGTLSDRYGRKSVLIIGMIIFIVGAFINIFVQTYAIFLLARILQGIGLGACLVLSRTISKDCFSGKAYTHVASYLSSGFAIGLGVPAVLGGLLVHFFSWRAEFILLFAMGVALLVCIILFLPETHVVTHREKVLTFTKKIFTNCYRALIDRYFVGYLLVGVMAYSVIVVYNTMTPYIVEKLLGHSASFYAWLTFTIAAIYYLGTSLNRKLVPYYSIKTLIRAGLVLIILAGLGMAGIYIVLHQFTIYAVGLPLFVAIIGQALVWSNCVAGALEDLTAIAGTASALFSSLQMLLSALISGLAAIPAAHTHNQIPLALFIAALGVGSWLAFRLCIVDKIDIS